MPETFVVDQYDSSYPKSVDKHFWSLARSDILHKQIKSFAPNVKTWIEVGCGTGVVVKHLRLKGLNIVGCELASVPKNLWQVDDLITGVNAIDLEISQRHEYDGLLLLDVLEHIDDPVAFLEELTASFPKLTKIIITVPARNEIWSNYDTFYGHYLRYDISKFTSDFQLESWETKHIQYFFHILYFVIYLWNILFAKRNVNMAKVDTKSLKFIHKCLARICVWDELFLPKKLLGSSLLAIMDKKKL